LHQLVGIPDVTAGQAGQSGRSRPGEQRMASSHASRSREVVMSGPWKEVIAEVVRQSTIEALMR
jgi:hypothetical protein